MVNHPQEEEKFHSLFLIPNNYLFIYKKLNFSNKNFQNKSEKKAYDWFGKSRKVREMGFRKKVDTLQLILQ